MASATQVLIVDDDPTFHFIHTKLLEVLGLEGSQISKAANGMEALNLFRSENFNPSIILLDLNMPKMDGFEFIKAFSKLNFSKRVPLVVVVSSSDNESDRSRIRSLGIKHYLTKPVSADALKQILRTVEIPQ